MKKVCQIKECYNKHHSKGMCQKHYARFLRTGTIGETEKVKRICGIEGCEKTVTANGLCMNHYKKEWRIKHGKN